MASRVLAVAPTCTVTATPSQVSSGETSVINWTSMNADSCNSSGHGTGTNGSFSVTPSVTTAYHVSCTKNAVNTASGCTGSYQAVVGQCQGTVHGSTGDYEGQSCNVFDENACAGWVVHGCHWNQYATTEASCSPFSHNECIANGGCVWNPSSTGIAQSTSCSGTVTVLPNTHTVPSGNISATSCTILDGASTCNSKVTWSTANLVSGVHFEITRNNPNHTNISSQSHAINFVNPINFGASTYYIYYDNTILGSSAVDAECITGDVWDGTKCVLSSLVNPIDINAHSNLNQPAGTISATSCTIPNGASTCNSNLNWTTSNLIHGVLFAVTRNNPEFTPVSTAPAGTNISNPIKIGNSTYFLYYNNQILGTAFASANCEYGSAWYDTSSSCEVTSLPANDVPASKNNPKNPHYQEN